MTLQNPAFAPEKPLPPRERIVAVARDLFYRHGFRAVGVDAIADAAGTNKMTLYRHFPSKDELLAECMRRFATEAGGIWARLEAAHPGDPLAQLHGWLARVAERVVDRAERGCPLSNTAVEIPDKDHPARRVIEQFKRDMRDHLAKLCARIGLAQPDLLADELFLLLEGARMCIQCTGPEGPAARLVRMGEAIIASHVGAARG